MEELREIGNILYDSARGDNVAKPHEFSASSILVETLLLKLDIYVNDVC